MEGLEAVVVKQHLGTVVGKHTAVSVLQEFLDVLVGGLRPDALEAIHAGIAADTIHRGHPEPPLAIAEDIFDLVVGQSHGVVGTEILVVFMSVVAVQSPEGAYPQLSRGILSDTLHTTVRQFLCQHKTVLLVLVPVAVLTVLSSAAHGQPRCHQDEQSPFRDISHLTLCFDCKDRK